MKGAHRETCASQVSTPWLCAAVDVSSLSYWSVKLLKTVDLVIHVPELTQSCNSKVFPDLWNPCPPKVPSNRAPLVSQVWLYRHFDDMKTLFPI
jgi:hypothetical protein